MNGHKIRALLDTGDSVSLINEKLLNSGQISKLKVFNRSVRDANGGTIAILGEIGSNLKTPEGEIDLRLLVFLDKALK